MVKYHSEQATVRNVTQVDSASASSATAGETLSGCALAGNSLMSTHVSHRRIEMEWVRYLAIK